MLLLSRSWVKPWSDKVFEERIKDYEVNIMEEKQNKENVEVLTGNSEGKIEKQNELDQFLDNYEPKESRKNISEFESIDVSDMIDIEWKTIEYPQKDGSVQKSKKMVCNIGEESVIVPVSVVTALKTINESAGMGKIKLFKVLKKGSGLDTEYTVVPLKFVGGD